VYLSKSPFIDFEGERHPIYAFIYPNDSIFRVRVNLITICGVVVECSRVVGTRLGFVGASMYSANQSVAFDHLIDIEYSSLPISVRNPCAATASPWVHSSGRAI